MNNKTVAQNWANQTGKGKNGSSMYYEGKTIYSYGSHFPMAYIFTRSNGNELYLVNNDRYSNSTCKHQNHVESAMNQNNKVIEVSTGLLQDMIYQLDRNDGLTQGTREKLILEVITRIEENQGKMERARTRKSMYEYMIDKDAQQLSSIYACLPVVEFIHSQYPL